MRQIKREEEKRLEEIEGSSPPTYLNNPSHTTPTYISHIKPPRLSNQYEDVLQHGTIASKNHTNSSKSTTIRGIHDLIYRVISPNNQPLPSKGPAKDPNLNNREKRRRTLRGNVKVSRRKVIRHVMSLPSNGHLDPSRRVSVQEKPSRPDRLLPRPADFAAQQPKGAKQSNQTKRPKCSATSAESSSVVTSLLEEACSASLIPILTFFASKTALFLAFPSETESSLTPSCSSETESSLTLLRLSLCLAEIVSDPSIVTNNSDSFEYSSANNSTEPKQMENNDRTPKELAMLDVYPQLKPAQTYELKSGLIHLLPKFHGLAGKDPHKHLKEFHVVYSTMRPQGIAEDYIKMKEFPFSLDGATKDWLYLQLLCATCPHHQISLTMMDRSMIDSTSGGALMDKTSIVARYLISNMARNTQQFGIRGVG
ncbi:hypothetical protein CR513_20197, partial [Mucuna pruriens]